ncbi:Syntaxin-8 [Tupaia chinensis]|uniref:Syntaxin-8 n=1 Tax=Tupaia chinensis TaxID=246437 RepID=L9JT89_TUPCH|nr:Syntaxin-8 [Tupaia chinensis]
MREEAKKGAPSPWFFEEPEETRGLGFNEIGQQQQQNRIQEEGAGLDALSSIISHRKQMGQEVGDELEEQNKMMDDLANLVENTGEKLRAEAGRVNLVDRKSASHSDNVIFRCSWPLWWLQSGHLTVGSQWTTLRDTRCDTAVMGKCSAAFWNTKPTLNSMPQSSGKK